MIKLLLGFWDFLFQKMTSFIYLFISITYRFFTIKVNMGYIVVYSQLNLIMANKYNRTIVFENVYIDECNALK